MKCVYEELSEQECKCFCGGDKAMRSLGNSVVQQLMDKNE